MAGRDGHGTLFTLRQQQGVSPIKPMSIIISLPISGSAEEGWAIDVFDDDQCLCHDYYAFISWLRGRVKQTWLSSVVAYGWLSFQDNPGFIQERILNTAANTISRCTLAIIFQ